jgi:ATP-binding protein involved in chromosome partitioning
MPLPPRAPMPRSIDLAEEGRTVVIVWRDERVDRHAARDLRLICPCANCVHEITKAPLLDPASVRADLAVERHRPVGNYAVQFTFSDGHSTGLYAYERLRGLRDE